MSYSSSGVRRHDPNSAVQAKPIIVEQVQRIEHAFHQVPPNLDSVRRASEASAQRDNETVPNLQPKVSGILGCTGTLFSGIKLVNNNRQYAHVVGSCIILTDVTDESNQRYLVDPNPPRTPAGSPVAQRSNSISAIAVSNSGRWLAVGGSGTPADVVIWDCEASPPTIIARLQHHTDGIRCLDFSPDDRFFLTAGDDTDKKLFVYDMMPYTSSNRPPALVTNSTSEGVLRVAFGPRTKDPRGNITALYQVATANHERVEFFIFDPVKGSFSTTGRVMLGAIKRKINTLQWDPTGTLVFAGSTSGDVCIVLASTRILVQTITPSPSASGAVGAVAFLNGGREVLVARRDGTVTTYRAGATLNANYVDIAQFKVGGSITSFVLGGGEAFAICGTEESTIYKVDLVSKNAKRLSQSHVAPLRDVSFSRDPSVRAFATSGLDGSVQVFDTDTLQQISMCGQLIPAGEAHGRESACICLSPPQLLVGYNNGAVKSYNYATGAELWQIERAHKSVSSIAVGPTQRYWVSGGSDGEVRCWNFVSRALITEVKEHSAPINGVAIFADAQRILSVSHDKRLVETDLPNAKLVSLHENRMGGISGIVLSPDEKEIITVGKDNAVSFWRLQSAHPTAVISACHGANGEPLCIALSSSGGIFATGDASGRIFLWHTKSRKQLNTLDAHTGAVRKLALSPDDHVLISVGDDGAIIKWTL